MMAGTVRSHSLPILRMPPKMTAAVITANVMPTGWGEMPKLKVAALVTELACVVQPTPKAAVSVHRAYRPPSLLLCKPFFNTYMGPPT